MFEAAAGAALRTAESGDYRLLVPGRLVVSGGTGVGALSSMSVEKSTTGSPAATRRHGRPRRWPRPPSFATQGRIEADTASGPPRAGPASRRAMATAGPRAVGGTWPAGATSPDTGAQTGLGQRLRGSRCSRQRPAVAAGGRSRRIAAIRQWQAPARPGWGRHGGPWPTRLLSRGRDRGRLRRC